MNDDLMKAAEQAIELDEFWWDGNVTPSDLFWFLHNTWGAYADDTGRGEESAYLLLMEAQVL